MRWLPTLPCLLACLVIMSACDGGTVDLQDEPDGAIGPDGSTPDDGEAALDDDASAPEDNDTVPEDEGGLEPDDDLPHGDGGFEDGAEGEADGADQGADEPVETSCTFPYDNWFGPPPPPPPSPRPERWVGPGPAPEPGVVDSIAWVEPLPPSVSWLPLPAPSPGGDKAIVFPDYSDDMPLFERGQAWNGETRCYETPLGVQHLDEAQAHDLWVAIAERTTGVIVPKTPGRRSVVGLRGAYPGTFAWHGNPPNRFNDTLVLLWVDAAGARHAREFPVNTDTGAHDFGEDSSSSIRPNRRYRYINGWHRGYNALQIDLAGYRVRDDHNTNGHWDSDRNGWLPPAGDDHDRAGSGHNIHMGSLDAPLGDALVDVWSAGCQVIPGTANWREFITTAWTAEGDPVDYFLIDARDIPPELWWPCAPDGSHACPYPIGALPFTDSRTTAGVPTRSFDVYNCSAADESGPEVMYVLTTDVGGTLSVSVDCPAGVDIDVYLLDGDDHRACLVRDHTDFTYDLVPGRYWIAADTFVEAGAELAGGYTLHVSLQ
ncbi:MAG TPA: hypothetical protein PK668_27345 [Myxococcota bacterium]|nr:hypothetical protein [Myxococcota bacterium]HRY97243.1 hypothetical protein [Myxococcota bacterium]HSA23669.1 hypothetical protein [Myxococcota bacterium]